MPLPVVHWEIFAKDMKKLGAFYGELFNWKLQPFGDAYLLADTGGEGGINGGIMQAHPGQPSVVTFYVMVDDLDAYLKKAESLGGKSCVPPTPIPGVGAFAMFTDPDGHCIGLFKSGGGSPPPKSTHAGCPVTWFEIAAKDGNKAREFYAKLFDWPIREDKALGYNEVQTAGPMSIGGGIMQAKDPNFLYVTFYVMVDDLEKYLKKAESLGGRTMLPSMPIPGVGTIAFFADPEGHTIGLYKKG